MPTASSNAARRQSNKALAILCICACTCLYALCWEGLLMVLPLVAEKVGAQSTMHWGYFQSFSSLVSFAGGLFAGPLKDRYGGKLLFLLSFAACCISYFLIGQATNLFVFYLAMLPNIVEQGWLAAQALAMDYSVESDRVVILGRVTAAYSIGQIIGPSVAGAVAAVSLQLVPIGASLLCFGGLMLVLWFLQDKPRQPATPDDAGKRPTGKLKSPNSSSHAATKPMPTFAQDLWAACTQPYIAMMLLMKFFARAGSSLFYSMLAKVLFSYFHQSSTSSGFLFSYMGVVGFLVQALVVGPISSSIKFEQIVGGSLVGLMLVALTFGLCSRLEHLVVVLLILELSENVFQTITVAMLTSLTDPKLSGTVIGVDTAVFTVAEVIGAMIGASLLTLGGTMALGLGAAVLLLPACVIASRLKISPDSARKDLLEIL